MEVFVRELTDLHRRLRGEICERLEEFDRIGKSASPADIFADLVFCILTPQSDAHLCWGAVEILRERNLLLKGSATKIAAVLRGRARFHNTKAKNIVLARKNLTELYEKIHTERSNRQLREWIVENIRGLGYKEASHFLRNIGRGEGLVILDRHIMRCLRDFGVIEEPPASFSKKRYLEMEELTRSWSRKACIPLLHLDFLFWHREKNEIFK